MDKVVRGLGKSHDRQRLVLGPEQKSLVLKLQGSCKIFSPDIMVLNAFARTPPAPWSSQFFEIKVRGWMFKVRWFSAKVYAKTCEGLSFSSARRKV